MYSLKLLTCPGERHIQRVYELHAHVYEMKCIFMIFQKLCQVLWIFKEMLLTLTRSCSMLSAWSAPLWISISEELSYRRVNSKSPGRGTFSKGDIPLSKLS